MYEHTQLNVLLNMIDSLTKKKELDVIRFIIHNTYLLCIKHYYSTVSLIITCSLKISSQFANLAIKTRPMVACGSIILTLLFVVLSSAGGWALLDCCVDSLKSILLLLRPTTGEGVGMGVGWITGGVLDGVGEGILSCVDSKHA